MTDPSDIVPPSPPTTHKTNRAGHTGPQQFASTFAGRSARFLLILAALAGALVLAPGSANAQGAGDCSDWEWHNEWERCLRDVPESSDDECAEPPTPSSPDSGMAGWFAEPSLPDKGEGIGQYSRYGYAGYQLPMYASKELSVGGQCIDSLSLPDGADTANALANMEFNVSTAVIGASNSMRQAAWDPQRLWGWSNEFMRTGSEAVYSQVFTIFGAVTVGVVGLYLLWRSRQADMNNAVTTAAWAVLILVLVTAVARWPVQAANWADEGMTAGLNLSQGLIEDEAAEGCISRPGISSSEYEELLEDNPTLCVDTRSAAVKASDMSTGDVLYQNWLRAMLGQGEEVSFREQDGEVVEDPDGNPEVRESNTAYKYGPALYAAQAMSWVEDDNAQNSTGNRARTIEEKQENWQKIAALIQQEDPESYEHLSGGRAWERTGSGLLALLTALFFSLFDITASVLIILGFMIVRFAVIALPIIGTIAILRPAGGPFKRLVNMVLAAVINVVVFAVAAVIYLFAADRILGANLPSWMQVMLIGLVGVAAWLLLRPFRRLSSLQGAGGPTDALFGRTVDKEKRKETEVERRRETIRQTETRPESRTDAPGRQSHRTEGKAAPLDHQPGQRTPGNATTSAAPSSAGSGTSSGGVYTPPRRS